ncbi:hypothetical protein Msil_3743 [Methylocella silvestris BL2]|uniref:Uncharacterized protein n=1 Tax=Methylocella silvestris (strain DSM 15510 / CIP 108128 / LMG 27833 / NCIMB 13906 / BL2) TaxID=395965 RepID=B8EJD3_METSB|nr:hypothetical protein [Methylocella silvestris]ACK52625.1 hypothetical protein Msil_3743 [Methylocella silvestris BL2]
MDSHTLSILSEVLQQAEAKLSTEGLTDEVRTGLATRILIVAQTGERDPKRLLTAALYWARARTNDAEAAALALAETETQNAADRRPGLPNYSEPLSERLGLV